MTCVTACPTDPSASRVRGWNPGAKGTYRSFMHTVDDAPYLDIFSAEFMDDPVPVIEDLRTQSWLVRTPIGGMVIGRNQVQALLSDRRLRSSIPEIVRMQGVTEGPLYDQLESS